MYFGDPWGNWLFEHIANKRPVIFVFGDPVAAVISTRMRRFDQVHARNCGCFRQLNEIDIYKEDCFHYELMFDSWTQQEHDYPVLCVRYESLPQHYSAIEEFLGRRVQWNEWKRRNTREFMVNDNQLKQIKITYWKLIAKVNEYPDLTINGKEV
jgi:hypothetical protein